jgi:hypothetical protein
MKALNLAGALCAIALAAGCGGEETEEEVVRPAASSAEGKSDEGKLSLKGPGIDVSLNIPEVARRQIRAGTESQLLPPGAALAGLHIQGGEGGGGGVELRFTSEEPPERAAAWYRDPARNAEFAIGSERRDGVATILAGRTNNGGDFTVHLTARGAGTEGRLVLAERE